MLIEEYLLSIELRMPMIEFIICLTVSGSDGQYSSAQRIT